MREWLEYFQHNRRHRRVIPWERGITVEPHVRAPLIESLQRFQVGETGEGVQLKRGARATGDATYAEAIALFIDEENEHARLLARALAAMHAAPLTSHWSDNVFVLVRRLMGLQLELVVLLSAEMIAKRYYRALYEGTQDAVLRILFAQIGDDEEGHIAFHCAFLGNAWAGLSPGQRWLAVAAWQLFFQTVCLVVAWDHRRVLHALGLSARHFVGDCLTIFAATTAAIRGVAASAAVEPPAKPSVGHR
jgi:hypothetical protein